MRKANHHHSGERVAHVTLDDPAGGAKTGVVEEFVGDAEQGVVILRGPDGHAEGFDVREVVPLHGIGGPGPVILKPRHFLALLRRPTGVLCLLLAVAIAVGLNILSNRWHWQGGITAIVGVVGIVVAVGLYIAAERSRRREERARVKS